MSEFDVKDYGQARNLATAIYNSANRIHEVFENLDNFASVMHISHWNSEGSDEVNAEYLANIKSQFEPFYEDVVAMKTHVETVTEHTAAADQIASSNIV